MFIRRNNQKKSRYCTICISTETSQYGPNGRHDKLPLPAAVRVLTYEQTASLHKAAALWQELDNVLNNTHLTSGQIRDVNKGMHDLEVISLKLH